MATIDTLKNLTTPGTPLFLFDITLSDGQTESYSTHSVTYNGTAYTARVMQHNLFDLRASSNQGIDSLANVSITLGNADSICSEIERNVGWKGALVTIQFLFFDLVNGVGLSESEVVFRGVANPPEESTESSFRVSFVSRLNLTRVYLPEVRIQRRCPWQFPSTLAQRQEGLSGGTEGRYDMFYRCGYSADVAGGVGNLSNGVAYTSCDYSRASCEQRGMFSADAQGNTTARFGGIEYVPSLVQVRGYGQGAREWSPVIDNQARYNDYVPLIYGTGWFAPPIVFSRNDGNLTRMQLLLGMGQINGVLKVIVNDIEIPAGQQGANMTATGWYNLVTAGGRDGAFDMDFTDAQGNPLGDPYGSMAYLSVVAPNRISDGITLPQVQVLVQGMLLDRYTAAGAYQDTVFTNNPAWVILDVLQRSGWSTEEIDLVSFAAAAAVCDSPVQGVDLNGNPVTVPQFQCNLILNFRRPASDVVRGIRNGSSLYLTMSQGGLLQLKAEGPIAQQQPAQIASSNSVEPINGGWPAYEFGDNSFSGILRRSNGESTLRVYSRPIADSPNQMAVEFQDEFNEYQQDSISLVDIDDVQLSGQPVTTSLTALGLPNFNQAARAITLQLNKSVQGNTYVDFETSVKAFGLNPGDLITLTYAREGWTRQLFRVTRIAPGPNYRTAMITAQIHDDAWYGPNALLGSGGIGRQAGAGTGLPRPLAGATTDGSGKPEFAITETDTESADGSYIVSLAVGFTPPARPAASAANIPLVGLNPSIALSGGTLAGGQTLYYAVSAVDGNGNETGLSFVVTATIPSGTQTNAVTLSGLSFSATTANFNVYRGATPQQLYRIAAAQAVAVEFTDSGAAETLVPPPDANYDHANFYWRFELLPQTPVNIESATTVGNSQLQMTANEFQGMIARISAGTGAGQERQILANTATTLTLAQSWTVTPDGTSEFVVVEAGWQFGSTASVSPATFTVPDRPGMTVEISGRAANVRNEETDPALSPITSWQIGGATVTPVDASVPPAPVFGLNAPGEGSVQVQAIGFNTLTNTRTITAGTLTLGYWDELSGPSTVTLSAAIAATDTTIVTVGQTGAQPGALLQVEAEVMLVIAVASDGVTLTVTRGEYGTTAASYNAGVTVWALTRMSFVLPFFPDFFGSPESGSYSFPIPFADKRIVTADLFMTNSRGSGPAAQEAFTGTTDYGLRTLSGGQLTMQVEGPLAIETNAAAPLVVDTTHAVRDIFAMVKQAPGAPVVVQVTQNGQTYGPQLTIAAGQTMSNVVDGMPLPPLGDKAQIGLNIVSVTPASDVAPGSDLTVTIRL